MNKSLSLFKNSYNEGIRIPLSYAGFTWLPEIVINQKITDISSVVGSGIWTFGFLASAQIFGFKGILMHSMIYGAGGALHAFYLLAENKNM
jgi:hypothetical protein